MVATAMEKIGLLGSRCLHFILAWPGGYLWASVGKQDAELGLVLWAQACGKWGQVVLWEEGDSFSWERHYSG